MTRTEIEKQVETCYDLFHTYSWNKDFDNADIMLNILDELNAEIAELDFWGFND